MGVKKAFAAVATACLAAVALTGCIRTEYSVDVTADGRFDNATLLVALDKQAFRALGAQADTQALRMLLEEGETDVGSCVYSETEAEVIAECIPFETWPDTSALTGVPTSYPVTIAEQGVVTLTWEVQPPVVDESLVAPEEESFNIKSRVLFRFPGPVLTVAGPGASVDPSDENTAIVDLTTFAGGTITITAATSPDTTSVYSWLIPGVAGVMLIMVGIARVMRERTPA